MAWYELGELLPKHIVKNFGFDEARTIVSFTADRDAVCAIDFVKIGRVELVHGLGRDKPVITARVDYSDLNGKSKRAFIYFELDVDKVKSKLDDQSFVEISINQFTYITEPPSGVSTMKISVAISEFGVKLLEVAQSVDRDFMIKFPTRDVVSSFKRGLKLGLFEEINRGHTEALSEFVNLDIDKVCNDLMSSVNVDLNDRMFSANAKLDVSSQHKTSFDNVDIFIASRTPVTYRLRSLPSCNDVKVGEPSTRFDAGWAAFELSQISEVVELDALDKDPVILIDHECTLDEFGDRLEVMARAEYERLMQILGFDYDRDDEQTFVDVRPDHRRESVYEFVKLLAKSGQLAGAIEQRESMLVRVEMSSFMSTLIAYR